jgi:hypothetical protein
MFAFAASRAFMLSPMGIALYVLGMGLINPLGTVIALHPFGTHAGWRPRCSVSSRWAARPSARRSQAFCRFSRPLLLPSL